MKACVITVGNEILKGHTVNSNAAEIGRALYFAGYEVFRGITVPDDPKEIGWAFRAALKTCDLVISSGGLGPTFDDMTVESFAGEFGFKLVVDAETDEKLKERMQRRGIEMTRERTKMATIPEGSTTVQNNVGSAPGIRAKIEGKKIFILPGVPREMRSMLDIIVEEIRLSDSFFTEESIVLKGIPEASLAPLTLELMDKYEGKIYIKTHPGMDENGVSRIEVEISTRTSDSSSGKNIVTKALEEYSLRAEEIKKSLKAD